MGLLDRNTAYLYGTIRPVGVRETRWDSNGWWDSSDWWDNSD
ncbi:hypothetical protein [Paenibacillus sp. FSL H7-0756]